MNVNDPRIVHTQRPSETEEPSSKRKILGILAAVVGALILAIVTYSFVYDRFGGSNEASANVVESRGVVSRAAVAETLQKEDAFCAAHGKEDGFNAWFCGDGHRWMGDVNGQLEKLDTRSPAHIKYLALAFVALLIWNVILTAKLAGKKDKEDAP